MISAEVLKELKLRKTPLDRYNAPKENEPVENKLNFIKAVRCVDRLATARFERFIPDEFVIDQSIDTSSYKHGWTFAMHMRNDVPPPVNELVTMKTGISPIKEDTEFLKWLAIEMKFIADQLGTKRMGPPLVFRTHGGNGTVPLIGLLMKFDRTPPQGFTTEDMMNDVGVIAMHDEFTPEHSFDFERDLQGVVDENSEMPDSIDVMEEKKNG